MCREDVCGREGAVVWVWTAERQLCGGQEKRPGQRDGYVGKDRCGGRNR